MQKNKEQIRPRLCPSKEPATAPGGIGFASPHPGFVKSCLGKEVLEERLRWDFPHGVLLFYAEETSRRTEGEMPHSPHLSRGAGHVTATTATASSTASTPFALKPKQEEVI